MNHSFPSQSQPCPHRNIGCFQNTLNDMSDLFKDKTAFNQVSCVVCQIPKVLMTIQCSLLTFVFNNQDISNWNTQYVTNMDNMFSNALAFNQVSIFLLLRKWYFLSTETNPTLHRIYPNGILDG